MDSQGQEKLMKLGLSLIVLGLVWLVAAIWDAATLAWVPYTLLYFIDAVQMLYIGFSAFAVTLILHSPKNVLAGIAMCWGVMTGADKEAVIAAVRAILFLGRAALWSGIVISLVELVVSAHNAASMADFLSALAVSMLAALYGLLIRIVCELGIQIPKVRLGPFVFYGQ
jgi:hypothetical protein